MSPLIFLILTKTPVWETFGDNFAPNLVIGATGKIMGPYFLGSSNRTRKIRHQDKLSATHIDFRYIVPKIWEIQFSPPKSYRISDPDPPEAGVRRNHQ